MTDGNVVLRAEDLHAAYGPRTVIQGVTLSLNDRQVTAIVGPSGCGKSTVLKALNRTLELTPQGRVVRGRISFRDIDLYGATADAHDVRRTIGLVQQRPVPFPMSILENVLFGVRFHGHWEGRRPEEAAREHLEEAGLWEEVKDRLGEPGFSLSAGQQQRLSIARTLANRPEFLLMDEPCSSLDPNATQKIEDLILRLRSKLGIVVVTHNLAQARRIADRVAVFWAQDGRGRLLEHGTTAQIFENPKDPLTAAYVGGKTG